MPLITHQQIARIASKAVPHIANAIVDHAGDVLPRYGLVTPLLVQHLMAQVFVETGYLRRIEEDLSYAAITPSDPGPTGRGVASQDVV